MECGLQGMPKRFLGSLADSPQARKDGTTWAGRYFVTTDGQSDPTLLFRALTWSALVSIFLLHSYIVIAPTSFNVL